MDFSLSVKMIRFNLAPQKQIDGYHKATSTNLPVVDITMVAEYFNRTSMFFNNETSGFKTSRSIGARYGDEAVGRVQIKNDAKSCHLIVSVTPEHKINDQPYIVQVFIDVIHRKIKKAECKGCIAALGGCKHVVAVIGWLHRRSEEPSPTEEICYWKKSPLSTVDISKPYDSDDNESSTFSDSEDSRDGFVANFAAECKRRKTNCHFLLHYNFSMFAVPTVQLSLHHLMCDFVSSNRNQKGSRFIQFCNENMSESVLRTIPLETKEQYKSTLWRELRYGRITGSVAYEMAHCKTADGSLIDKVFGKRTIDTKAMRRGRELEPNVKLSMQKKLREKITDTGLWLKASLPIFGASPDGFGPNKKYSVEIKCPSSQETYNQYVKNGKIVNKKSFAQVQLQMHITGTKLCKFCVADPDYEKNKRIEIIDVKYNENYVLTELISPCIKYWTENIFQKIRHVVVVE